MSVNVNAPTDGSVAVAMLKLSKRELQGLKRGDKVNVFIGPLACKSMLFSVYTAIVKYFSPRMKRELEVKMAKSVHLPFAKEPVKFVIGWMEEGGIDKMGIGAVSYPQNHVGNLEILFRLAIHLEIGPLIARTLNDIETITRIHRKGVQPSVALAQGLPTCKILPLPASAQTNGIVKAGSTPTVPSLTKETTSQPIAMKKKNTCSFCEKPGHVRRDCQDRKALIGKCYKCFERGHREASCPKKALGVGKKPELRSERLEIDPAVRATGSTLPVQEESEKAQDLHEKPVTNGFMPTEPAITNTSLTPVGGTIVVVDCAGNELTLDWSAIKLHIEGAAAAGIVSITGTATIK